jgi:hypothetical protein
LGARKGVHNWLRKWAIGSTRRVFTVLLTQAGVEDELDRVVVVDTTI